MKLYDESKICFIICNNHEQDLEECLLYLSLLEVPEGFETELFVIENSETLAKGYNEGMQASNAKYKIYLHPNALVVETKILQKLIDLFESDKQIGMIGSVGSASLPKDAIMWHGDMCGKVYRAADWNKSCHTEIAEVENGYREVEVIQGDFMATQYDLPWREDILDGWSFHDVSHSFEFQRAGYKVIVPAQKSLWVQHVKGRCYGLYDEEQRLKVLTEYVDFFANKDKPRILFVHSDKIRLAGLVGCFMEMGLEVIEFTHRIKILKVIASEVDLLIEALEEGRFDLVVTYDFIASVSVACENVGVKYYSWVYDSPLLSLYTKEAKNSVNYISVFDKKQCERLQEEGLAHVKYFPLATEVNLFAAVKITEEDEKKYSADVSFLGRLYEKRGFEELFQGGPKEYLEEAEAIMREKLCQWDGENHLYGKASDELISYMHSKIAPSEYMNYNVDKRYFCESMKLARKCNEYERVEVLNKVAEKFKVTLYTENTEQSALSNVKIHPWVDYLYEMPKVFALSKINLNITSRSIETGIPQRVWDILAVGGFCLTNYQQELEDYFEVGKDLEVYHNPEELLEKIDYYLKNEKERLRIALNGYKKVREYHSYEKRLQEIFEWIFEGEKSGWN